MFVKVDVAEKMFVMNNGREIQAMLMFGPI
jgi:hypothetical protein